LLKIQVKEIQKTFAQISTLLESETLTPWLAFLAAVAVVLREGFESILIIFAFLTFIRATGEKSAAKWIHFGWLSALGMGILTWFLVGTVIHISGANREVIEGLTTLIAVIVLLYVGFWLHRHTSLSRWKAFVGGKIRAALQGEKLIGLAFVSFIAVYREALETVLFLRAFSLEGNGATSLGMFLGVGVTLLAVILLAWLILEKTVTLQVRKLFLFSASMMVVLGFILSGKTVHSLQEAGWLPIHNLFFNLRFDLFGLYPTWETILAQLGVLGFIGFIFWWNRKEDYWSEEGLE
jgi:high-affinity iron transporter